MTSEHYNLYIDSGLEDSELADAEALEEDIEVVAYEYEPDGYGEYTCLCRLKG